MLSSLFITCLFFLSAMAQTSLVQSWSPAWNYFPLHLIVGLLVMHRYDLNLGVLWFLLTIPLAIWGFQPGSAWSYFGVAVAGYLLISRLFTTNSVYALFGLGLTVSATYLIINILLGQLNYNFSEIITFELEILIGIYLGNIVVFYWRRFASRWLFIRSL